MWILHGDQVCGRSPPELVDHSLQLIFYVYQLDFHIQSHTSHAIYVIWSLLYPSKLPSTLWMFQPTESQYLFNYNLGLRSRLGTYSCKNTCWESDSAHSQPHVSQLWYEAPPGRVGGHPRFALLFEHVGGSVPTICGFIYSFTRQVKKSAMTWTLLSALCFHKKRAKQAVLNLEDLKSQ